MRENDFSWRGTLASEMGVVVTQQVQYKRPAKRSVRYQVAGCSGTLEADVPDTWDDVIYAPACALRPDADLEEAMRWLMGEGELIFGSMPDHAFLARVADAFDTSAMMEGHPGSYTLFTPIFQCNPLRRSVLTETPITLNDENLPWMNRGNVPCKPLICVQATAAGTTEMVIAGQHFAVQMPQAGTVEIDTELYTALPAMEGLTLIGDMPVIPPGVWRANISSGEAEVSILQRERWV